MRKFGQINLDPLYQLFEFHLFNRSYEDTTAFTKEIAEEYLVYLDSGPAHVPFHSRSTILKDLESEAQEMLVKKMYGCNHNANKTNYGLVMKLHDEELAPVNFSPPKSSEETPKKN